MRVAVQKRLRRIETRSDGRDRNLADGLDEIALHCAWLPISRVRSEDEILGYNERGLPDQVVIDTSALLAILINEPERRLFDERSRVIPRLTSAASYLEAAIIIDDRLGFEGARDLGLFLAESNIEIEPVTPLNRRRRRTRLRARQSPCSLEFR